MSWMRSYKIRRTYEEAIKCKNLYEYNYNKNGSVYRYACLIKPDWKGVRPVVWRNRTCTHCLRWTLELVKQLKLDSWC